MARVALLRDEVVEAEGDTGPRGPASIISSIGEGGEGGEAGWPPSAARPAFSTAWKRKIVREMFTPHITLISTSEKMLAPQTAEVLIPQRSGWQGVRGPVHDHEAPI